MSWKHRCTLPFHHMSMRPDGKIFPCCYFRWEETPDDLNSTHPDPFNHPFLVDIREKMLKDEYIEGCSKCYQDEEQSGRSMRLDMNSSEIEFGFPDEGKGEIPKLTNIDLALSNVCNNKCRMCGPQLSTQWYSDAKKLGWDLPKGVIAKNTVIEDTDLSQLRFIKLLGGEPLMEQDKFLQVLDQCNIEELTLLLVSNTSLTPNTKLTEYLKRMKRVTIQLSIDAHGGMNEFLRKGSNWETTKETIKWYNREFKDYRHIDVSVHSVASIYNFNLCIDLMNFVYKQNLYHNYVIADGPNWMMPRNLPEQFKKYAIKSVREQKQKVNFNLKKVFHLLEHEIQQPGDFGLFYRNDAKLNEIRNEHWKQHNPWLYDNIQKYVTEDIM